MLLGKARNGRHMKNKWKITIKI